MLRGGVSPLSFSLISSDSFFLLINIIDENHLTCPFIFPQLVVTVLSHHRTDLGEAKLESRVSPETQPNQAALLLDTMPT
jgi:hypothetical protein